MAYAKSDHCNLTETTTKVKQAYKASATRDFLTVCLSSLKDIGLSEEATNFLTAEEVNHLFKLKLSTVIEVMQDVKYKIINGWTQQKSMEAIVKNFDEAEQSLISSKNSIDKEDQVG